MHLGRIVVLIGSVLAVVGLAMKALTMDGEDALPGLNALNDAFPTGIPTIFGGLETWTQIVVVVALIVVVVLAFLPPLKQPESVVAAAATIVVGLGFFAYAIVKYNETSDDAAALQAGLDRADSLGVLPDGVGNVETSMGFFILMGATALVAIGGVLALLGGKKSAEAPA